MGSVSPRELSGARELLGSVSAPVLDAARNPFAARAVVCVLLLSPDDRERARQIATIASNDEALAHETAQLARTARIGARERLPVLETCAAALALLSPAQYAQFRTTVAQLIAADGQVDRVEWTVRVVLRHVVESRGAAPDPRGRATADDLALVTSVLAWSGASDAEGALRAWRAARGAEASLPASPVPAQRCSLDALDGSLRAFAGSGASMKRRLVDACVACVSADGRTTVEEAELLRAVCASIGAPMPPVLPVASGD
jgi:tellurite resistance protein